VAGDRRDGLRRLVRPQAALGVELGAGAGEEDERDEQQGGHGGDGHGTSVARAADGLTAIVHSQIARVRGDPTGMDTDEEMEDVDAGLAPDRFLRATIAGGSLTLNPPLRGTIRGGPASMTLTRLDSVVLVDLRPAGEDDDELVATPPPNAPAIGRPARRVLTQWAALVGYRRLWLPDAVVDLEPPPPVGTATVRCPTCASGWADSSEGFWSTVRRNRHFPGYCPACGGSLPEWSTATRGR